MTQDLSRAVLIFACVSFISTCTFIFLMTIHTDVIIRRIRGSGSLTVNWTGLKLVPTIGLEENLSLPLFETIDSDMAIFSLQSLLRQEDDHLSPVYNYFIPAETVCSKRPLSLLVLIPSAPDNRQRRDAIRNTWASPVYHGLTRGVQTQNVRLAFFIGGSRLNATQRSQLRQESDQFNDVVVAGFCDTPDNLSLKMSLAITWAGTHCRDAPFVAKIDDDVFLHVDLLLSVLSRSPDGPQGTSMGFLRHSYQNPPVKRQVKKPYTHFPASFIGYAYVLSRAAVRALTASLLRLSPEALEHASIKVVLAHCSAFSNPRRPLTRCDVVHRRFATFKVDPEEFDSLWESVRLKNCTDRWI